VAIPPAVVPEPSRRSLRAAIDERFGIRRADRGDWLAYESLGAPAATSPVDRVAAGLHDAMAPAKLTEEHRTFLVGRRSIY
jgi:hypothetical protein